MLHRKHGGRHKDCALLAVADAFKAGAQCNLSFAEANIAAKQAVHRCRFFHIALDFVGTAELIVGFIIFKAKFKIAL